MGSDNTPSQNNNNNNGNYQKSYSSDQSLNSSVSTQSYKTTDNLQILRRHSNIRDSNLSSNISHHLTSKNLTNLYNPLPNISTNKKSNELPTLEERNKTRKLSQQYCADFKKNYLAENKNYFLNRLADSLNHGIQIPIEEIEKFKEEYMPKYLLDWRNVEDPKTGVRYWKNFGKIYPNEENKMKLDKLGNNPIGSSQPFFLKRIWLYRYLMKNFARQKNENPIISVNRNNILEDSYNAFLKTKEFNLARPLRIRFINEKVLDEEGVYREWYQCMFKELISPNKKLLILNKYKSLEPNTVLFYPKYPGMKLEYYEFLAKLIVKAICDIIFIRNLNINRVLLKSITKRPITLEDIKYYNLDLYKNLKIINDNQIAGNKQLESIRFVYSYRDPNNLVKEIELVPGGKNIFLNDKNKFLLIDKIIYVEAIMPYEEQIKYSQKGLYSLLGNDVHGVFSVEELNFLLSGLDDIDLNDWKENTIYKGVYNENHPIIKLFWEKLGTMKKNEIIRFLEFSTGTGSVPIDGFGSLKGIGGRIQKFTIEPYINYSSDNPEQYVFYKIEAKRLYNTISLPLYRTKQELDQAINIILYNK